MLPAVSVVIPTYNHRAFIIEALDSVFAQTFTDHEIIVVNDGSPDDSAAILRPLLESGRIRYIEQRNAGQGSARNKGIAQAKGEFIALLDDDDTWPPDKLQWQMQALKEDPEALAVYGYAERFGNLEGEHRPWPSAPSGWIFDQLVGQNWVHSPGQMLIRRSALVSLGGFDSGIWGTDDWDLWLRLSKTGKILYRHQLALRYRTHETNASLHFWRMYRNGLKVANKHFGRWPFSRDGTRRRMAVAFVRGFVAHDALRLLYRRRDNGQRLRFAMEWLVLLMIKPSLLPTRLFVDNCLWFLLPIGWYRRVKDYRRMHAIADGRSGAE
jgi:glycosyltransferase involved in cell wall biosynthesis